MSAKSRQRPRQTAAQQRLAIECAKVSDSKAALEFRTKALDRRENELELREDALRVKTNERSASIENLERKVRALERSAARRRWTLCGVAVAALGMGMALGACAW